MINGLFLLAAVVAVVGTWFVLASEPRTSPRVHSSAENDQVFDNPYATPPRPHLRLVHDHHRQPEAEQDERKIS